MNQEFDISGFLENQFNNVNYWLNFAELKNSINVAFGIAFMAAVLSTEIVVGLCKYSIIIIVCISMIISFVSFFPRIGTKIFRLKAQSNNPNLVFYEDCQCYTGTEYLKLVNIRYLNNRNYNNSEYQKHLADEIVYNSHVTSMKYKFFRGSVILDIMALLLVIIGIFV